MVTRRHSPRQSKLRMASLNRESVALSAVCTRYRNGWNLRHYKYPKAAAPGLTSFADYTPEK